MSKFFQSIDSFGCKGVLKNIFIQQYIIESEIIEKTTKNKANVKSETVEK